MNILSKKREDAKYSDLSSRDQKEILKKTIRQANNDQMSIIREFDKKFSHSNNRI